MQTVQFFFVCKKLVQIVQDFCTEKKLVQIGQVFFCLQLQFVFRTTKYDWKKVCRINKELHSLWNLPPTH